MDSAEQFLLEVLACAGQCGSEPEVIVAALMGGARMARTLGHAGVADDLLDHVERLAGDRVSIGG